MDLPFLWAALTAATAALVAIGVLLPQHFCLRARSQPEAPAEAPPETHPAQPAQCASAPGRFGHAEPSLEGLRRVASSPHPHLVSWEWLA